MSFIFYISHILGSNLAWTKSVIEKFYTLWDNSENTLSTFCIQYTAFLIFLNKKSFICQLILT